MCGPVCRGVSAFALGGVVNGSSEFADAVTAVVGAADLLHRSWDALSDDERREMVGMLARQSSRLAALLPGLQVYPPAPPNAAASQSV